uniref:2,3-bisphosphoglycerate-independent phosphoglycerate mutase n=1 Tax=Thuretia quercifolia TaxID=189650 RepID=A0A1Z1MJX1_9FLOR|nr:phosphoglycerate mutase [Thuretia quercifolia]ARW66367.1 phosphoglycerate mutase [Thuretia quercifolia]
MHKKPIYPIILAILDGWGHSEKTKGNAIKLANTPTIDKLWQNYPHSLLSASGEDVGLPSNQMGNSEVGHTTIGAGRTINQDLVRIQKSIEDKTFFTNPTIHNICQTVKTRKSKLHVIGLCSNGGVHSHINHLKALIEIIKKYNHLVCLHLITDGRDTSPKITISFIKEIFEHINNNENIKICTISGRYYSMDRDCRWSRTEKIYKILIEDNYIEENNNFTEIINKYYENNISDEFIPPTRINKGKISDNDGILFFNFRPDRIRQLLHSLAKNTFKGFKVKKFNNLFLTTFTNYDSTLNIPVVFPSKNEKNFLGQIISNYGLKQLRLAETEKYAHVTYFLNGGIEEPFPGEDRELIPSPKVDTYDLKPDMSAYQVTESLINAINKNIYKLIIVNYANPDMIGHTGNLEATIKAIEVVDECIAKLFNETKKNKGTLILTADHGNADYMLDEENKPCKSHSTNLVPFILIENNNETKLINKLESKGCLADIAPTILNILKINIPEEMNGQSLIIKNNIKTLI